MKTILFALLAFLPFSATALTPPRGVLHIILVGGQSNAVGQDSAKEFPASSTTRDQVPFFYAVVPHKGGAMEEPVYTTLRPGASHVADGVGPEIAFGRDLARYYEKTKPNDRVAIIKFAHGGTNLHTQWKAGGDATTQGDGPVYRNFQKIVSLGMDALEKDPALNGYDYHIDAMLWVQGEADLTHGHAKDYAENLAAFISDVRLTYNSDLIFLFSRISDSQTLFSESEDADTRANYQLIRENQAKVAKSVKRSIMVDIDGSKFSMLEQSFYKPFLLHFDAKGTMEIGKAFADAYIEGMKSLGSR